MAYTIDFDSTNRVIANHWTGELTLSSLEAYLADISRDPNHRNFNELLDFRDIENIKLPTEALQAFAAKSSAIDQPDVRARTAVVTSPGLAYGLARMFSAFREMTLDDDRQFSVFTRTDEAAAWIAQCEDP